MLVEKGSELAHLYGAATLDRRFTDVLLFENGKWQLLARQSTVIRPPVVSLAR